MVFSISLTILWPVSGLSGLIHIWAPFTWATCLGMSLLSYARLRGFQHAIPCPEIFCLVSSHAPGLMFAFFLPSSRVASVDEMLLAFDGRFFSYAGESVGAMFRQHLGLALLCMLVYLALPLAGVLVYLALPSVALRWKYCVASALGLTVLILFRICPAAGPVFLLHTDFPFAIPALAAPHARLIPNVILNAIPSGHVAWALIIYWFAHRYCGLAARLLVGAFLFFTCFATLGLGQHYLIDLIVAVPFAAALWAMVHGQRRFARVALAVVLIWLVALRQGWVLPIPPALVWVLMGITVVPFMFHGTALEAGFSLRPSLHAAALRWHSLTIPRPGHAVSAATTSVQTGSSAAWWTSR
jgi:hypothetical protein